MERSFRVPNSISASLSPAPAPESSASCGRDGYQPRLGAASILLYNASQGLSFMNKPALLMVVGLVAVVCFAQSDHVPAFNNGNVKPGEAQILPKDQQWGEAFQYPYQAKAYELAAKIPNVLNQMPCYCYCERMGHKSLHTCFELTHGAKCGICMKEVFFAYEQTKLKKTPAEIRTAIIKGDWQSVDLEKAAKND